MEDVAFLVVGDPFGFVLNSSLQLHYIDIVNNILMLILVLTEICYFYYTHQNSQELARITVTCLPISVHQTLI